MNDLIFFYLYSIVFFLLWYIFSRRKPCSVNLYLYHTFWGSIFLYYSLNNPSDTRYLFTDNNLENCQLVLQVPLDNSNVIFCFAYLLKKYFINSYGLLCSLFCFVGFLGLNIFYGFSKEIILKNKLDRYLISYFFFLPTISFWTTINFKDSLIILFYAVTLESIYKIVKNKLSKIQLLKFIICLLLSLLVRPYSILFVISTLILISTFFVIKALINKKINKSLFIFLCISIICTIPLTKFTSEQLSMTKDFETGKPILFPPDKSINKPQIKLDKLNLELIKSRIERSKILANNSKSFTEKKGFKKLAKILFGPFNLNSVKYKLETLSGVYFFVIFFRVIYLISIKRSILVRPDIMFALAIFTLELIKIQLGIFNFGIITRHRVSLYLLFSFIYILISKYNHDSNCKKELSQ